MSAHCANKNLGTYLPSDTSFYPALILRCMEIPSSKGTGGPKGGKKIGTVL